MTVSENGTVEASYTYDANGNRKSVTYGNGTAEIYEYNLANWVTKLYNKKGNGGVISNYSYEYYVSGNQKSKTESTGAVTTYIYDDLGRLTRESESDGTILSYTYDAAGNRARLTATGIESYVTDYTYDNANRLLTETKTVDGAEETTTYTYDANGNTLTVTAPESLQVNTYNLFNQLVTTNINGNCSAYTYNTAGIRTAKTVDKLTTVFLLDGGNVVGEVQNDTVKATYLRGANLISRESTTAKQYYVFNAHGDVTALVGTDGSINKRYDYDAFGNEKDIVETDQNPFRYCGEYFDKETGTYYLRARYYDPSIGRFTQQDTHWNTANMIYGDNPNKINEREDVLGLKTYTYAPSINSIMQSGNLYVYCVNNPVYYCDYNGYWVETAFDIATLGVSIADVYNNPDDGWAWAGLIGDVIDLCPFVMGVGEVIKAKRVTNALTGVGEVVEGAYKSSRIINKTNVGSFWGISKDGVNQGIRHFFEYGEKSYKRIHSIAEKLGVDDFELTEDGFVDFTTAALKVVDNYAELGGKMKQMGEKCVYYYNDVIVITYEGKLQSVMVGSIEYFNRMS